MRAIIGYWGRFVSDQQKLDLEKALARIKAAGPVNHQTLSSSFKPESETGHSHVTEITLFENDSAFDYLSGDESLSVSLSASGVPGETDIRVQADSRSLGLFRDQFGRVTLFWTKQMGAIWFSTRLQLLLSLLESKRVSLSGLYGYSCFSYVPTPETTVEKIFAVPAGDEIGFESGRYLESDFIETRTRIQEWQEADELTEDEELSRVRLRRLLNESIESQLCDTGSEPVGVFLSGGLDSSITAALLVQAGVRVKAFALDFGEYGLSEMPSAEMVAAHLAVPLVKVRATPQRIRKAIQSTAIALDLPYGDGVTVPLYLLGEAASSECSIVFNGEGGDQLFAGWTNKPIIASGIYAGLTVEKSNFHHEYLKTFHRLYGYESSVFAGDLLSDLSELDVLDWLEAALDDTFTPSLLHRLRRANLMLKGAQNIQPRATNLAFAHGLKVRSPFCYKPLARWSFQVLQALFLRGQCEKYLLKRAVEDLLPSEIVWREKRGMGVPLTEWLRGPLWREVGAWLAPDTLRREGRWQSDVAIRVALGRLSGHRQGRRIGELLWMMMMWQAWRKTVLSEEVRKPFCNPFWLRPGWWEWRLSRKEDKAWQQL